MEELKRRFLTAVDEFKVDEWSVEGFSLPDVSWQQFVATGLNIAVVHRTFRLQASEDNDGSFEEVFKESRETVSVTPRSLRCDGNGECVFVGTHTEGEYSQDTYAQWGTTYTITITKDGTASLAVEPI